MKPISLTELAQAMGAARQDWQGAADAVVSDSRRVTPGCVFVAIRGENFDGHDFVPQALSAGAAAAVVDHPLPGCGDRLMVVPDTKNALIAAGGCYRSHFSLPVVGVTGSVGKTTTKEMTAAVLQSRYRTLKTEGNLNNEIGVPQMLFQLTEQTEAAVLEMGMTGLGEIAALTRAVRPTVGIITNVGTSHIGRLGSRENILRAKLEIAEGMADGAVLLLNGDNDLLGGVRLPRLDVAFFGLEGDFPLTAGDIEEDGGATRFVIRWRGGRYPARLPCVGRHHVYDALAAFGAGVALGIAPEAAAAALACYEPSGMRQHMVEHHGILVVEDCYNASPDSMAAALATLAQLNPRGRRVAVLSDMLELGETSRQSHLEVGRLAARCADVLFCWGEEAKHYAEGFETVKPGAYYFEDKKEFARRLTEFLQPGDAVWLKASRGMKLEEVVRAIYEEC